MNPAAMLVYVTNPTLEDGNHVHATYLSTYAYTVIPGNHVMLNDDES
jgi:hypothetical protein